MTTYDPTCGLVEPMIWTSVEASIGVFCACLPTPRKSLMAYPAPPSLSSLLKALMSKTDYSTPGPLFSPVLNPVFDYLGRAHPRESLSSTRCYLEDATRNPAASASAHHPRPLRQNSVMRRENGLEFGRPNRRPDVDLEPPWPLNAEWPLSNSVTLSCPQREHDGKALPSLPSESVPRGI